MAVPGTAVVVPSVLVICRSACGVSESVSVAVLSVGAGAVTPAGGVSVAVLVSVPVAAGSIWTVKEKVTLPPAGRSAVVANAPVPLVGPVTVPPPAALTNAQVAAVTPAGRASVTLAPVTAL